MALRDAAVRLVLQAGSFAGGLRQLTRDTERVGAQMGKALSAPVKAGLKAARDAAGGLANELKGALKYASTLGGALGAGAGIQRALTLTSTYKDLAFEMSLATGQAVKWQDVQRSVGDAALATSRSSDELAVAFKTVKDETGDIGLATTSMRAIGIAANVSGKSTEELASVVGALNDKFGVTAKEMPDTLAAMLELSNRGGLGFGDLTKAIHLMGGSARAAGYTGADGVRRMIAIANIGGDALGSLKKSMGAIQSITDSLADPSAAKALQQTFGVATKDKSGALRDMTDVLADVMGKTKGSRVALGKVFKGEELKLVTEVGKYFAKGYETATGSEKERIAAGAKSFREALADAGKTATNFAALEKANAKRVEDPQRKLQQSMELFYQSFTKPEMLSAMDQLATTMPVIAEGFAKIVEFVIKNPALAGGAYVGARVGGAGLSAFAGSAASAVSKKAYAGIGEMIAADAAKSGAWMTAGKTVGVAAAALIAYELGKEQINKALDKDQDLLTRLNIATEHARTLASDPMASPAAKKQALTELQEAKAAKEREGMGWATATFGGIAAAVTGDASLDPAARGAQARAGAGQMIDVLSGQLGDTSDNARRAAAAFQSVALEAQKAAEELRKVKGGGASGSNGLPPAPPTGPGAG